jgi:hypothetical protein
MTTKLIIALLCAAVTILVLDFFAHPVSRASTNFSWSKLLSGGTQPTKRPRKADPVAVAFSLQLIWIVPFAALSLQKQFLQFIRERRLRNGQS